MTGFIRKIVILLALFMVAANAWAQADYSGVWRLTTMTQIPDEKLPCSYSGTAQISQIGDELGGTASLVLDSGPDACPSEMTAKVSGFATSTGVEMGLLLGGQLGEAQFYSSRSGPTAASTAQAGQKTETEAVMAIGGPFDVTSGPFAGQTGSWTAMMATAIMNVPVPTLAFYGLLVLALVLLIVGGIRIRRRHLA